LLPAPQAEPNAALRLTPAVKKTWKKTLTKAADSLEGGINNAKGDSRMHCQLIDVCMGCYLQDHHNRAGELLLGAAVDGTTSRYDVMQELLSELNARDMSHDESFDYDAAKGAIKSFFAEAYGTSGLRLDVEFDVSLEVPTDEELEMGEPCQAWFLLTWETSEE
jgi:hypothetical protein